MRTVPAPRGHLGALLALSTLALLGAPGCGGPAPTVLEGSFFASPLLVEGPAGRALVLAGNRGAIAAFDAQTDEPLWTQQLAAPTGQDLYLFATPVAVDGRLVVAYHTQDPQSGVRNSHRVVVLDLASGATKAQLLAAMEGHILAEAEIIGNFQA